MNPMTALVVLYGELAAAWRELPLEPFARGLLKTALVFILFFAIIYSFERAFSVRARYRSQLFLNDLVYWFYYCAGVHRLLFLVALFAVLEHPLSFLDLKLLVPLPFAVQAILYLVLIDFVSYWTHRAQHHFRLLWAFHTTHHSQESVSFATSARLHPVDRLLPDLVTYVVLRIIGIDPLTWLPLALAYDFLGALIHSQVPWKYGPLYKVFVSPGFHAYHHSVDPAHHNKHFSGVFPVWDHLFGTAVAETEPAPTRFGLEQLKSISFWATLTAPFALLCKFYIRRERTKETAAI